MRKAKDLTSGRHLRRLIALSKLSPPEVRAALLKLAEPNPPHLRFKRYAILSTKPPFRVARRGSMPGLRTIIRIDVRPGDNGGSIVECLAYPQPWRAGLFHATQILFFASLAIGAVGKLLSLTLPDGSDVATVTFCGALLIGCVAVTVWSCNLQPLPMAIIYLEQALDVYGIIFERPQIQEEGDDD
jgi:hypothetical protein